jgi:hypothetical protein
MFRSLMSSDRIDLKVGFLGSEVVYHGYNQTSISSSSRLCALSVENLYLYDSRLCFLMWLFQ